MGATYGNVTLRGPTQEQVVRALTEQGMTAVVSPSDQGLTVVYDCRCEADPDAAAAVARWMSRRFGCAAWGVYVFDSDVVVYTLCRGGEVLDQYHSAPGYPDFVRGAPQGGDAAVLCREMALKPVEAAAVEGILRRKRVTFEEQRHGDLMQALGHSHLAFVTRHSDFYRGEPLPDGYAPEQFRAVGGAVCPYSYPFEAELRVGTPPASGGSPGGGSPGGGVGTWIAAAVLGGAFYWLWKGRNDGMSRRHFVALLGAGGAAAAFGVAHDVEPRAFG